MTSSDNVPRKRKVVVLGSTGSIGTSALKVARDIPDRMEIVGLAASRSIESLAAQVRDTGVQHVALTAPGAPEAFQKLNSEVTVHAGPDGLIELATLPEADLVLISIVGTAGLAPALAAIEAGKDIAVASKEILVMAGHIVIRKARQHGVKVLPVDSEHNAVFQCLESCEDPDSVSRIILTASGGPFRTWPDDQLESVTVEQALNHPTWDMGRKITIDSATLFNKGLEMIEARWLFDVPMDRIDVVVHPQSIVHSMVEFRDGSVLAQLSQSDMCFPIQYAVTWPDRVENSLRTLDFAALGQLEFESPRISAFPALHLAREAGNTGGSLPAVLNAANEIAVDAFVEGRIPFPRIWETVEEVMEEHSNVSQPDLEALLQADTWARNAAKRKTGLS